VEVRDNHRRSRYELWDDDELIGIADYHATDGALVFPHTEIVAPHRGSGLGDRLVGGALEDVRRRGLRVVAHCWFVADYLERHPQVAEAVT
jgi:predicted GNAT family acetyltransferase